jgi:N-hydroxyarylamine O-acetyltransferase
MSAMQADNFNLQDYLARIGYKGQPSADIETLRAVMRCQLLSVPFENLDVQAGKVISMVPEVIVDKLVYGQRGGYCYEVNGLFAMALQALGFEYQLVAARPMFYPCRRPKTHMAIVVKLGQQGWLCDLGFGSYGIRAPMSLGALDLEIQQDSDYFMLSASSQDTFLLKAKVEQHWQQQFEFDLTPWEFIDFAPANYMNSTHPDSIFVQKLLVVLQTSEGRHVLFGNTLKSFTNGVVEKRILSAEDRTDTLETVFGLTVVDQA